MNNFAKSILCSMTLAAALGGCKSNESKPDPAPQAQAAPAAQPQAASAPAAGDSANSDKGQKEKPGAKTAKGKPAAAQAEAPATGNSGHYNLSKNKPVTDSSKVEAGQGTTVKGLNDWEGEISGIPAANSKFTRLKIGMSLQQVIDLVGAPTDQGAYVTGKAFIPFYYGSDRTRWEAVYKGQGRLVFANQAGFGTGQYLVWIIHNSNEPGHR